MTYRIIKLGAEYPGPCVVCGARVERAETAQAVLLKPTVGNFAICHLACCPVKHTTTRKRGLLYTETKTTFKEKEFSVPAPRKRKR